MSLPPARGTDTLHSELHRVGPGLGLVSGLPGVGKTHALRAALDGDPAAVFYRALPLPDSDHRSLLASALHRWAGGETSFERLDWPDLLAAVAEESALTRRRLVLAVADAHRLVESRSRTPALIAEGWSSIRARSVPVHLVLAGPSPDLDASFGAADGPLADHVTFRTTIEPLDYRAVARHVPRYGLRDRLRTWAVFGGRPRRLRHVDPGVSLATNVRRLVLDRQGALFADARAELADVTSSPARYLATLRAMAGGAAGWGEIVEHTSGVDSGGQLAPYLTRLEELGLVRAERSLDARPRSRRRRYRITDPFLAFWPHLVLPQVSDLEMERGPDVWTRRVRPALERHMARWLPAVARTWLARYARERLPSTAREVGGLWGAGYDLDPAGTLRTGPVVYGLARWSDEPMDPTHDEAVATQIRTTRYGFGREARLRLLVSAGGFTPALVRRAARDPMLHLVGPEELVGT